MSNHRRNKALKTVAFLLFLCMLAWNLGAIAFPRLVVQDSQTLTPAPTQSSEPEESPVSETPTEPAGTAIGSGDIDNQNPGSPPLPAVFSGGSYVPGELVVRFKGSTSQSRIDECFQGNNLQVQSEIEELRTFVLKTDPEEMASTFYQVLDCPGALYVEPNFLLQAADTLPNDPGWGNQYGLVNIRAPQGWDLVTGSSAITIAVVDSGVDYNHPDLAGKLVTGYDFVNNDEDPQDDNGHGTHVAGIAAATSNNNVGMAGVSWGARIMPVKVLDNKGSGNFANTANGVIWAVDHGAQVINLSLGGDYESAILKDAIDYAHNRGAVIVAAAGNAGNTPVLFPARYTNVIAVARTDSADHWNGSNFGPEIDLSAPGASIYSTVIGGYDYKSGSSMSTGFVSGLAAVLMSVPGNGSPDLIEYQMETTALDIEFAGWDEYTGAGLIQMDGAIQLALQAVNLTDDSASFNRSSGGGPGPGQVASTDTFTPSPTWTASPTFVTPETTITPTAETQFINNTDGTATSAPVREERNEVEAQDKSGNINFFLPCIGILFIVLGIAIFFLSRRKKSNRSFSKN